MSQGESDRFQDILREHWPMLARLASSYARNAAQRDDLLQDIAIAVWQALPRWREKGSLRAFIARVGHNRAIDVLTKDLRQPVGALDDNIPDPVADPVRQAQTGQQREGLLAAVRCLPLGQRQVVSLSLEGFSHREIAEVLGMDENTVAQRLSRARRQLRELMGGAR